MNENIDVQVIAEFLNTEYIGENYVIKKPTSLACIATNCIAFTNQNSINDFSTESCLILAGNNFSDDNITSMSLIKTGNPRLAFAKILREFFTVRPKVGIGLATSVGKSSNIHDTVSIGNNCYIGDGVSIGKGTIINHNVIIHNNTQIGDNCYIKSGAILGEEGFGFEKDDDGVSIRIPHVGNLVIENNVEVGANTVVCRGTLDSTIIKKDVKLDDMVFIAHNCYIGERTLVIAGAEISGSVVIGTDCWIAPHSTIIQKVHIGNNTTIGIGSTILKDIDDNKKIMGLEGIELRKLIKLKRQIKYGQ